MKSHVDIMFVRVCRRWRMNPSTIPTRQYARLHITILVSLSWRVVYGPRQSFYISILIWLLTSSTAKNSIVPLVRVFTVLDVLKTNDWLMRHCQSSKVPKHMQPSFFRFLLQQLATVPPVEHEDLSGKTVVVIGANVGLGFEAAKHFARMNPDRIILGCRSKERGEAAATSETNQLLVISLRISLTWCI